MGVSYAILDREKLIDKKAKSIYYLQLIENLIWPILFFILKNRFLSIIWICILVVLVIYMISIFYKKNKIAGYLQIPYLLWTIFATYLNIGIYLLNKN